MSRLVRVAALSLGALSSLLAPSPSRAQVLAKTLLFNSVQPCRVADTRAAAAGNLLGGVPRTFDVVGAAINYSGQGGVAGGCGIPGFVGGVPQVQAVAINVVAVDPSGDGFLTVWPSDRPLPSASTVNFQKLVPNLNIANGVIVPVRQDLPGGDITIVAGVSDAHVIVDITGYFTRAEPRKYYLTTTAVPSDQALSACAAGYHMASLWEIFDPSALSYDLGLGLTAGDAGTGPPNSAFGWIHTGFLADVSAFEGRANCNLWTSTEATDNGTSVNLSTNWKVASTKVSPWDVLLRNCATSNRVWCVED